MIKFENIIYVFSIIILSVVMFAEFNIKKTMYTGEKINDLQIQYKSKLIFNDKIIEALFDEILEDDYMKGLLAESNKGIEKDQNREKLYNHYKEQFESFKERGIEQFQFHLSSGESFLRFHKPQRYGDNLLFRKSIQKVIQSRQKVIGFEIGRYFEGFRYIYPLFFKGEYIGSVEASVKTSYLLEQMKEMLDARYNVILKKDEISKNVEKGRINDLYHSFCADDKYLMANSTHNDKDLVKDTLMEIKGDVYDSLGKKDSFVSFGHDKEGNVKAFIFIPILDVNGKDVGYFFSVRDDNTIHMIALMQLVKYAVALILFTLLLYFYKQTRNKTITIEQLTNAIDQTTLVSKTNPKGIITYVNDAFEKLSGFSKSELIGSPHNIVREESTPRSLFRDMWKTIKKKEVWHGIITNRAKNGSKYTVDATILPIVDLNGKIKEYIAIRHDITELEKYKEILKEQLEDTTKSLEENINYTRQYEEAINNSTAVLKTDTDNIIIYANDQFCELSGYAKDELKGMDCKELRHENHIRTGDCENIKEKMENKEVMSIVFTNVAKNKELFFLDTIIYPIVNKKGEIIEHLHLMHDISEIINLHQELEDTQKEIIYKMGEIGETRSKETGNHVKRVAEYSRLLAVLYGLGEKEAEMLRLASPMHDIGKVGIPDSVLKKPGKLDKEEWEIMQSHAELGYEMLKHSGRPILKAAATVAGEHHEKWDGSGYPKGLKGKDIHIYGRITAVADVFDALGSDRCYKKAWELDRILELFKEEKGRHFDPDLVDLFFDNLDEFLKIRDEFRD